jgi:DNA-binding NarL/FixJ family response regulator
MPHSNGAEVYFEVRRWSPGTRVVVVTGLNTVRLFQELVAAGIDGLFLKTSSSEALRAALPRIAAGQKVIAGEVQAMLHRGDPKAALTPRELQVLQALARGETNQMIGTRLGISPRTVDSHRTSLMAKLDVHATAALVAQAMRDGLLD